MLGTAVLLTGLGKIKIYSLKMKVHARSLWAVAGSLVMTNEGTLPITKRRADMHDTQCLK